MSVAAARLAEAEAERLYLSAARCQVRGDLETATVRRNLAKDVLRRAALDHLPPVVRTLASPQIRRLQETTARLRVDDIDRSVWTKFLDAATREMAEGPA